MTYYDTFETPLGTVFVGGSAEGIHRIDFIRDPSVGHDGGDLAHCVAHLEGDTHESATHDPQAAAEAVAQLRAYFAGARTSFDVPLAPKGTAFQRSVWDMLLTIPQGRTTTYGTLASALGRPTASRAVGTAVGQNPLAVVVPCHRVVGAKGALTGYAGGLERKAWLLRHESAEVRGVQPTVELLQAS